MQCNADTTLHGKGGCYSESVPSDKLHYKPLQGVAVILLICVLVVSSFDSRAVASGCSD